MRTAGLFLSLLILVGPTPGQGQLLREGELVKISSSIVKGTLVVVDADGEVLVLQSLDGREEMNVPVASVRRLAAYRGPRSRGAGALRGGGYGLLIGGAVGAASGIVSGDDDCDSSVPCILPMTAGEKAAAGGLVLGVVGGALGLLIGAAVPGDRWERIDLPSQVEVGMIGSGGFALSAGVRF